MRHCVPDDVSSGLSNLPLAYVFVDGIPDSNQPTSQTLPTGETLSGRTAYRKFLEFYTAAGVTPEQLRREALSELEVWFKKVIHTVR